MENKSLSGLKELIGYECRADLYEWVIPGSPAWVIVDDVDLPFIKMRSKWNEKEKSMWYNVQVIKSIQIMKIHTEK